ncbi:MAG TPA: type II secretion system F family protein, partial [Acidimicrobiales bacterium]
MIRRGMRAAADAAVPAVLDAVVAALRSGRTVRDGLEAAAEHGLLAPVLRDVLSRSEHAPLRDALDRLASAHPLPSLRFAAVAMVLALDSGAAQATTLETAAHRARDRV